MKVIERMMQITGLSEEECLNSCPNSMEEFDGNFELMCTEGGDHCEECLYQDLKNKYKIDLLLWNEDMDIARGKVSEFKSENEFIQTIKKAFIEYDLGNCMVENIEKDTCISTGDGLEPETCHRVKDTDIEIATYYIADVVAVE